MGNNVECFLVILRSSGRAMTTKEILTHAKNYPELCIGCRSGTHVIVAGLELIEKGFVSKKLMKGGYKWSLK